MSGWQEIFLSWDQFERVEWEADAGFPFTKADQLQSMAFGFNTPFGSLDEAKAVKELILCCWLPEDYGEQ